MTMMDLINRAVGCGLECVYPLFGVKRMVVGSGSVEIVENISSHCFICRVYDKDGNYVTQCVTSHNVREVSEAEIKELMGNVGVNI